MLIRQLVFAGVATIVVGSAIWALWPRPVAVETARIERHDISETVEDEGISRIRQVFTVSAPIAGRLMRSGLEAGDKVVAGQTVVASIRSADPALLDARSRAAALSNIAAAQSAVDLASAQLRQAQSQLDFASAERQRSEKLAERGILADQMLQKAMLDFQVAQTGLDSARANVAMRQRELDAAKASLIEGAGAGDGSDCCLQVEAPVSGEVLQVLTQNEQVVQAGAPILTLGDPADLEATVDLLSRDAVAVTAGDRASIEDWGGPSLDAVVERVDPSAVTKVSALGIEEQRVTVVLKLLGTPASRARLGHDFRIVARITVWEGKSLAAVPIGALFRLSGDWAVYKVVDGVAHVARIELGHQNSDYAEILKGLVPGETVILHPSDHISEGTVVRSE